MKPAFKALLILIFLGGTLAACGGGTTNNSMSTTTVGDELAALEEAYAKDLLTEKEYDAQRKKILAKK